MSSKEILAWSKDPRSKLASFEATRRRLPALARLKAKKRWNTQDCKRAKRANGFNFRMDGTRKERGCTTKINVSLRNWGRKAPGCRLPRGLAKFW